MKLYRNNGQGRFSDVTAASGLDVPLYGMGVAVGDYDNDGDADVFISGLGLNQLFRNDAGQFSDITTSAGVGGAPDTWSTSAGFADIDNDGDLDLLVANYVRWSRQIDFHVDFQFRNAILQGIIKASQDERYRAGQHQQGRSNGLHHQLVRGHDRDRPPRIAIGRLLLELGEGQAVHVADDRHHEPLLGADRHPDVVVVVIDDVLAVDVGIDCRDGFQGLHTHQDLLDLVGMHPSW